MSVIDKIKFGGITYDVGKTPDTTLAVSGSPADAAKVGTELDKKVDKVTGKGLSTEDFTTAEKTKLAEIAEGATNIVIDPTLTQSGQAADAKVTGDRIDWLKSAINHALLISPVFTINNNKYINGTSLIDGTVTNYKRASTEIIDKFADKIQVYPKYGYTAYVGARQGTAWYVLSDSITEPAEFNLSNYDAFFVKVSCDDPITHTDCVDITYNVLYQIDSKCADSSLAIKGSGQNKLGFEYGTLENGTPITSTTRCRTINFIPVRPGDTVLIDDDYDLSVTEYDSNFTFVSVSGWLPVKQYTVISGSYIKVVARKNVYSPDLTDADVSAVNIAVYVFNISTRVSKLASDIDSVELNIGNIAIQLTVRNGLLVGYMHDGNGRYYYNNSHTRNSLITPLYAEYETHIWCDSGQSIAFQFFDGGETGSDHLLSATGWLKSYIIPVGSYWCMTLKNDNDAETTASTNNHVYAYDAQPINERVAENTQEIIDIKSKFVMGANYAVAANLCKTPLSAEQKGVLTYLQAFCIYNGKYYSTNGTNISAQDASFTEVQNVALSVGHGNSMQLGTTQSNYAYISGWDDQSIFVVNLDTLAIVDTITLPTSGYTTVAVDDVNGIAYIFQRSTYPSTEERYNFIVYDYANERVVSTKKTFRAFAAIQAVDFYEGKIYVLNGMGTSTAPNYYLIYNTSGDVIGEYVLGDFELSEPEGVFVDRETKELFVSFADKKLYLLK